MLCCVVVKKYVFQIEGLTGKQIFNENGRSDARCVVFEGSVNDSRWAVSEGNDSSSTSSCDIARKRNVGGSKIRTA